MARDYNPDRKVLRYAGMMGHQYAIVGTVDNQSRLKGECDDLHTARKIMANPSDRLYVRRGRTYRQVITG